MLLPIYQMIQNTWPGVWMEPITEATKIKQLMEIHVKDGIHKLLINMIWQKNSTHLVVLSQIIVEIPMLQSQFGAMQQVKMLIWVGNYANHLRHLKIKNQNFHLQAILQVLVFLYHLFAFCLVLFVVVALWFYTSSLQVKTMLLLLQEKPKVNEIVSLLNRMRYEQELIP